MNREILFRGKRGDNGEWVYGVTIQSNDGLSMIRELYHVDGAEYNAIEYDIIPETVGQFTGLTDKNGSKIFEGDIVNERLLDACEPQGYYDCKSIVEMVQGCWVLSQVGFDYSNTPLYERSFLFEAVDIEITGNIHDNPTT